MGKVSTTHTGKVCQSWSSNTPHMPGSDVTDDNFPDGSRKAAKNYCRNPDGELQGVWCYTMDPNQRWEVCDVPFCCKSAVKCICQRMMCVICN